MPKKQSPASRLAFRRNSIKGQISMAYRAFERIVNLETGLLDTNDLSALHSCKITLGSILKRWDKHYIKKNYKKLMGDKT